MEPRIAKAIARIDNLPPVGMAYGEPASARLAKAVKSRRIGSALEILQVHFADDHGLIDEVASVLGVYPNVATSIKRFSTQQPSAPKEA